MSSAEVIPITRNQPSPNQLPVQTADHLLPPVAGPDGAAGQLPAPEAPVLTLVPTEVETPAQETERNPHEILARLDEVREGARQDALAAGRSRTDANRAADETESNYFQSTFADQVQGQSPTEFRQSVLGTHELDDDANYRGRHAGPYGLSAEDYDKYLDNKFPVGREAMRRDAAALEEATDAEIANYNSMTDEQITAAANDEQYVLGLPDRAAEALTTRARRINPELYPTRGSVQAPAQEAAAPAVEPSAADAAEEAREVIEETAMPAADIKVGDEAPVESALPAVWRSATEQPDGTVTETKVDLLAPGEATAEPAEAQTVLPAVKDSASEQGSDANVTDEFRAKRDQMSETRKDDGLDGILDGMRAPEQKERATGRARALATRLGRGALSRARTILATPPTPGRTNMSDMAARQSRREVFLPPTGGTGQSNDVWMASEVQRQFAEDAARKSEANNRQPE